MNEKDRERRSIEFGKAICEKLKNDPSLFQIPITNIQRWQEKEGWKDPALEEWKILLNGNKEEIYKILTGEDSHSQRIRSSNPFTGILNQEERYQIMQKYK